MTATQTPPAESVGPAASWRASRRLAARVSTGHVLMVVCGVAAALLVFVAIRSADHTVQVAVAAEQLRAGQRIGATSFAYTPVHADDAVLATLIHPAAAEQLVGWIVTTAVEPGDLISRRMLRAPQAAAAQRAMSIPIAANRAAGGRLSPGDVIDVVEVLDGTARYVVTGVEVLEVHQGGQGLAAAATGGGFALSVAVDDASALRLSAAIEHGAIHIVRSTGAGLADQPAYTPAEQDGEGAQGGED